MGDSVMPRYRQMSKTNKQQGEQQQTTHKTTSASVQKLTPPRSGIDFIDQQHTGKAAHIQRKHNGLPTALQQGIESLSGIAMDDVNVHYNSPKPAQLNAHAYAQGTDIHLASGQEKHLPHEAWHVVQQKQGRVQATQQLKGNIAVNDNEGLEREADIMGARAKAMSFTTSPKQEKTINTSNTKQLKTNPSFSTHIIQKANKRKTWGGNFSTDRYQPIKENFVGRSIGADIRIVFKTARGNTPKDAKIGLIQIVRLEGAKPSSTLNKKLLKQSGSNTAWAIDRSEDSNPVYGSYDDDNHKSQTLTDNPPTLDNQGRGNRLGKRNSSGSNQSAILEDTPVLPLNKSKKQGQYFETSSMILEGEHKGLILGTVSWGWEKAAGESEATCLPFTLVQNKGATENFDQARKDWNAIADTNELVKLPGGGIGATSISIV